MNAIVDQIVNSTSNTIDNPAEYQLKTNFYEGGYVDLIFHRLRHRIPKLTKDFMNGTFTSYPKSLTDEEKEAKRLENVQRAATRAKQKVQHSIRQIHADHMLTLHTRENIQDRDTFFEIFTRFIRLVREKDLINGQLVTRSEKREYPFVAVPELQDRGAYHMHIAVVGKQDLPLLRACWYIALGGSISDKDEAVRGQIDVTSQEKRWGGETEQFKTMKLVSYLCKYIGKSFDADEKLGATRYTKSRNIPKVVTMKQYLLACWSNGQKTFVDAIAETISIASFIGVGDDFQMFNRGQDLFILRGKIYD